MGRTGLVFIVIITAFALWGGYYFATAPDGAELFVSENCNKCHRLRGEGLGRRDLTDVTQRRSRDWIQDQIVNPRLHDPHPGMPSFAHLSCREVEAIIDHLEND